MQSNPRQISLRRAAIWAPFVKAIPCVALGGYSLWLLTTPMDGLVYIFGFLVAQFWLLCGVGYLSAALLLSRRSLGWRLSGGIIDVAATAVVALVILWFADQSAANVTSCCQGDPNAVPVVILAAIAIVWIAASFPMLAWFLLGAVAQFDRRRQPT
jgi:hypothetical protein